MLRQFFIALSESKTMRAVAERSPMGKRASARFVAGLTMADIMRVRSATEQIAQFLLEMKVRLSKRGIIDLPMSRWQIADYFGLRIETVSRALSTFQRENIIKFQDSGQRRVVIRDRQRLQQLASDASDFDYWSILKHRKTVKGRRLAANEARETRPPGTPSLIPT